MLNFNWKFLVPVSLASGDWVLFHARGLGTLEEVSENLTMRQLGLHPRPLCLVDVGKFWEPFLALLDQMVEGHFAKPEHRALVHVSASPEDGLEYIDRYAPVDIPDKWTD